MLDEVLEILLQFLKVVDLRLHIVAFYFFKLLNLLGEILPDEVECQIVGVKWLLEGIFDIRLLVNRLVQKVLVFGVLPFLRVGAVLQVVQICEDWPLYDLLRIILALYLSLGEQVK